VPGVILAAAYLLWLYQRVFFGKVENVKNEKLLDLSGRELATLIPLVIIAFWIGLYPKPFFQILSTPVNNLVATVRPDYPGIIKPVLATQPVAPAESPVAAPQPPVLAPEATSAPETTKSVERPFRVASKTPSSHQNRLQPAAGRAGKLSSGATDSRSLRSGDQKKVASGRDDNHVVGTHASGRDDKSIVGTVPVTTATATLAAVTK
jgi:hypothetical protein